MDDRAPEMDSTSRTEDETSVADDGVDAQKVLLRFVFMIVIAVIYGVSRVVVGAVVVLQFLWFMFTREPNDRLSEFGQSLAAYTYQIVRYLAFVTDDRPFPFDLEWPGDSIAPDDATGGSSAADT